MKPTAKPISTLLIGGHLQVNRMGYGAMRLTQLHRIDPQVPVEETLGPVAEAVKAGKIKHAGLSEVDINGIQRAEKVVPIVSVQNLYNLGNRGWEPVLDYAAQRNMAFKPSKSCCRMRISRLCRTGNKHQP
jgi:aryl-alcohol dehydrogenase-like predicted oxidoreductase